MLIVWIVLAVLVIAIPIAMYNRLVRLRNQCRESWSGIDTELKRRYDLIPNLVETVKGYMAHERNTLEQVIAARNSAQAATSKASARLVLPAAAGPISASVRIDATAAPAPGSGLGMGYLPQRVPMESSMQSLAAAETRP